MEIRTGVPPSSTSLVSTLTPTATPSPQPSETPLPPTSQPTAPSLAPVEGITSTQLNVRAEPSTAGHILGMIPANTKLEITGKDPGENWWQINYLEGVDGKGWVTAQYVTTTNQPDVPMIGGSEIDPNNSNVAVVQQQLNVRSGPGTGYNSLGTLNAQDVVNLIGKDPNGSWLQINFAAGPEGKGWINAAFVQAQGVENLPIVTEAGLVVGTGTPTSIPFTPTATVVPAQEDHDSAGSPIVSVLFDPYGTQTVIYNGDISTPEGDNEDWIAFRPYDRSVFISLVCQGNSSPVIEMTENSSPTNLDLACNTPLKQVRVEPGSNYVIHMQVVTSADSLQYANYVLTIKMRP